jgi:myo-inositol-1(or 4)-monophosphatase
MPELSSYLDVACQAAQRAGAILVRHFEQGVVVRSKQEYNLVSDADIEAERAVVAAIRQRFPEHAILAEEEHAASTEAEHLWVVDPLDGTNNFVHGIPHFAVSIAYYQAGQAQCGVVFNPVRGDWYVAQRGGGATCNGQTMRVSSHTRLSQVLVGLGFYYDRGALMQGTLDAIRDLFAEKIHGIRRFGTASLDLCHVAQGRFGAFFEYQLAPWDFAAGRLIVEEAGGRVTTCRGEPLPLRLSSVLASNGTLHDAVLRIVQAHLPPPH